MDKDTVSKLKSMFVHSAIIVLAGIVTIIVLSFIGACEAWIFLVIFSIIYFFYEFLDKEYRTELKESSIWTRTILYRILIIVTFLFWTFFVCYYYS